MAWKPLTRRTESNRRRPRHKQTTTERGYGYDWQKLRKAIGFTKTTRPLCVDCLEQGMVTPAEDAHHMVKIVVDGSKRLDAENVRVLCKPCHDRRTARGE